MTSVSSLFAEARDLIRNKDQTLLVILDDPDFKDALAMIVGQQAAEMLLTKDWEEVLGNQLTLGYMVVALVVAWGKEIKNC